MNGATKYERQMVSRFRRAMEAAPDAETRREVRKLAARFQLANQKRRGLRRCLLATIRNMFNPE